MQAATSKTGSLYVPNAACICYLWLYMYLPPVALYVQLHIGLKLYMCSYYICHMQPVFATCGSICGATYRASGTGSLCPKCGTYRLGSGYTCVGGSMLSRALLQLYTGCCMLCCSSIQAVAGSVAALCRLLHALLQLYTGCCMLCCSSTQAVACSVAALYRLDNGYTCAGGSMLYVCSMCMLYVYDPSATCSLWLHSAYI